MRRTWWAMGASAALWAATIGMSPSAALAAGSPDLRVSIAGNFPQGPNSGGNIGLMWTNVGTANVTGVTHLTIDFPVGLLTSGGYIVGSTFTGSQTVSADGRHADIVFIGTIVPGSTVSMKLFVGSGADWQPGRSGAPSRTRPTPTRRTTRRPSPRPADSCPHLRRNQRPSPPESIRRAVRQPVAPPRP